MTQRPTATAVRDTFLHHYAYSRGQRGETIIRDLNKEQSTTRSYAGRTVFELLQNALDRAERRVLVALTPGPEPLLVVGNDGPGVGVDPNFDYDPPDFANVRKRSDFHALCSINTSNKSVAESIGNKGVGFRSVFSLGERVQVWSRLAGPEGGCWGLEMLSDWTRDKAERRRQEEPAVDEGWKWLAESPLLEATDSRHRPSFYFPLPLRASVLPAVYPGLDAMELETVVLVPLSEASAIEQARQTLKELKGRHLYFVGLREGKESVVVTVHSESDAPHRLPLSYSGEADRRVGLVASWRVPEEEKDQHHLTQQARLAGHELPRPGVALAWPKEMLGSAGTPQPPGVYGYLPTRIDPPLGVELHADFRLEENRTHINSDARDAVGAYNAALLEAVAELHLVTVLRAFGLNDVEIEQFPWSDGKRRGFRHIGAVSQCTQKTDGAKRADLFWLLRPLVSAEKDDHPLIRHLERLLFGDAHEWHDADCYRRWAVLAARFFGTEPGQGVARRAYDLFWQATGKWLERAVAKRPTSFGHRQRYTAQCTNALVQALRDSRARVVPLVTDGPKSTEELVGQAFPAPDRREERDGGGRLQFRLFFRPSDEAQEHPLALPEAVLERGRAVTSYPLGANLAGASLKSLGVADFGRWDILADLRQLPSAFDHWAPGALLTPEKHLDLLAFVAQLYATRFRGSEPPQESRDRYGWGWRGDVFHASEMPARAGRALATLFLRTTEGLYEPARQLSAGQVDREWLAWLAERVPGLDLDGFLYFLGVSPVAELLLVEDGQKGLVKGCVAPPALTDADGPGGKLELVVRASPESLAASLTQAWPLLEPVLRGENEGRLRLGLRSVLSNLAFVPCDQPGFHVPLELRGPAPRFVSPDEVVLLRALDRRRPVLFSLDVAEGNLRKLLVALGAIDGLDDRYLQDREADAALRVLRTLCKLDLERVARRPAARTALVELFQNVLDAVARGAPTQTVPVLLGYVPAQNNEPLSLTERELRWFTEDMPACIAKDNADREWIRRLFPQQPLITATLGNEVIQRVRALETRRATVVTTVRVNSEPQAQQARELKRTLEDLLPGLLALAELSRQVTGGLKLDDIGERWRRLEILRVENVWFHVQLEAGGSVRHGDWLKDSRGDVVAEEARGAPPKIWLDAPEEPSGPPWLRAFAEPLAITVVGNPVVAGIFALALAEFDGGGGNSDAAAARQRFDAYLQKQGAARLAHAYGRELKPLSEEQRAVLFDGVRQALASLGLVLRGTAQSELPRVLGLRNLELMSPTSGECREESVRQALRTARLPEELRPFVPDFACRSENEESWKDWLSEDRRRERLLLLAQHLKAGSVSAQAADTDLANAAMHKAWERDLEKEAEREFGRLGFSPTVVAYQWLVQGLEGKPVPFDEPDLLKHLIVPNRYDAVTTLVDASDCSWKTRSLQPTQPSGRELPPQTPEQRHAEDLKKGAIGADGEEAFLAFVLDSTAKILSRFPDAGWTALEQTTGEKSMRRRLLHEARGAAAGTEGLRKALHVSRYDGAAGFDMLGLELDESDAPRAVCYECKALPDGDHARVHISRNELATMRRLRREPGRGRWMLIGVHTGGKAQDLTHLLELVHDESRGPLAELAQQGLTFDSLILSIYSEADLAPTPPQSQKT